MFNMNVCFQVVIAFKAYTFILLSSFFHLCVCLMSCFSFQTASRTRNKKKQIPNFSQKCHVTITLKLPSCYSKGWKQIAYSFFNAPARVPTGISLSVKMKSPLFITVLRIVNKSQKIYLYDIIDILLVNANISSIECIILRKVMTINFKFDFY